jgi:hypothetical protein
MIVASGTSAAEPNRRAQCGAFTRPSGDVCHGSDGRRTLYAQGETWRLVRLGIHL